MPKLNQPHEARGGPDSDSHIPVTPFIKTWGNARFAEAAGRKPTPRLSHRIATLQVLSHGYIVCRMRMNRYALLGIFVVAFIIPFSDAVRSAGQKPQYSLSSDQLNTLCDQGKPSACFTLGTMYASGAGVTKDNPRAIALFQKACDGGDAQGCGALGFMYETGSGIQKDLAHALNLYRKACDGGGGLGCAFLAVLYEKGTGTTKNLAMAATLYERACEAGNSLGCGELLSPA